MTALLITEVFPPQTGGSGRWFWEIYRRLPAGAVRVAAHDYAGSNEFDRSHDLGIERMPLSLGEWGLRAGGLRGYVAAFRRLRRIVREGGVTAVHAARCLPEGWIARMLKAFCGVPYLVFVHGEDIESAATSRELAWMVRRVFAGAELLIANSEHTASLLRDRWGHGHGEKVRVLNPGVDLDYFRPAARDGEVRTRLGWSNGPVVLTVGRLQRRKGHDMLIRALPAIAARVPDVLYAVVGDGGEKEYLHGLVRELGVERHVRFHGELTDGRLLEAYQQCDLFALPNRRVASDIEGFGMVLVEAQACGRPVLAGNSGGTPETMRVGESGVVIDCRAPEPLAAAVLELLSDPARLDEMGRAARRHVETHFDWNVLARTAAELFEGVPMARRASTKVAAAR